MPREGQLSINVCIQYASAAWTLNSYGGNILIYKNGSVIRDLGYHRIQAVGTYGLNIKGACRLAVASGDTIEIKTQHGEAAARSLTNVDYANTLSLVLE
jgi:hypothetical protein